MKRKQPMINCIAFIAVDCTANDCEKREAAQLRVMQEYAKAHRIRIVGVVRRHFFGSAATNQKFTEVLQLLGEGKADGVIVDSVMNISKDVPDAYMKVSKVHELGRKMVSVKEGELRLDLRMAN